MILFLILLFIGLFLWAKEKNKQHESRVVQEEEKNNFVRPLSNAEIENQYFNMRTELLLKKKYPTLISWNWEKGSMNCFHYINPVNGITVVYRDGTKQHVLLYTAEVWGPKVVERKAAISPETVESNVEDSESFVIDIETQVTEYLKENAAKIETTVQEAIKTGGGFMTTFSVEQELATENFMKNLIQQLEKNTEYSVSFNNNVLEINFQDAIM